MYEIIKLVSKKEERCLSKSALFNSRDNRKMSNDGASKKFQNYNNDLETAISAQNKMLACRDASSEHSQYIKTRIKFKKDDKQYSEILKTVFSHHDVSIFKNIEYSNIDLLNQSDVSRYFHHNGNYYIPPKIHIGLSENNPSITYDEFYDELSHTLDDKSQNRLIFLVGNVGIGKTTFLCNFISKKYEEFEKEGVLPVKINLDTATGHQIPEISEIILKIKSGIIQFLRSNKIFDSKNIEEIATESACDEDVDRLVADANLNHLLSILKSNYNKKVVLFIDNIDYLYHIGDRGFFASGGDEHPERQKVREAHSVIIDFINIFWRDDSFMSSRQGMSVVISCRRDTISFLMSRQHEVPITGLEDNIFSLPQPNTERAKKVIAARFDLVKKLAEKIPEDTKRIEYIDQSERLKKSYQDRSRVGNILLDDLWLISRKGLRDMIQQISEFSWLEFLDGKKTGLNIRFTQQYYPSMLAYMLSGYRRYSQFSGNVPNIYLINAPMQSNEVGVPLEFKEPHKYTFWLKRMILAYLDQRSKINTNLEDVLYVFCGRNGRAYSQNLVRYCLSSLLEVPSSEMIEVDVAADGGAGNRGYIQGISITNRGRFILNEFSNSIRYLQLVLDDWRLLFPSDLCHMFSYKDPDYSYLVLDEKEYGESLDEILENKCKDVFRFSIFLEEMLKFEKKILPNVYQRLSDEGVSINFDGIITNNVRSEIEKLSGALHLELDLKYLDRENERRSRALMIDRLNRVFAPCISIQKKYYS